MHIRTIGGAAVAAFALYSTGANAGLHFNEQAENSHDTLTQVFDPNLPGSGAVSFMGTYATLGALVVNSTSVVSYTFLGREAAYTDTMVLTMGSDAGGTSFDNKHTELGATFTTYQTAGLLDFAFVDAKGYGTANGDVFGASPLISWGVLEGATSPYGVFDFIIGLNDSAGPGLRDYDDMVVGISLTAIPEPAVGTLMSAGLALLALAGRRQRATRHGC